MRYILLLLFFLYCNVQAQNFTITWAFNGNTNSSSTSANASGTNAILSQVNEAGYIAGCSGNAWSIYGWKTTFQTNEYIEVSITPASGYKMSLSNIACNVFRSGSGPTNIYLRSNQDNYIADLGTGSVGTACGAFNTGLGFNNLTSNVVFRLYSAGSTAGLGNIKFDDLVISGSVSPISLPVFLASFDTKVKSNEVKISWETFWERNTDFFNVQKSIDNQHFETIGVLKSIGNSYQRSVYNFVDKTPTEGINYYRLKQVDFNGTFSYSKTIFIEFDPEISEVFVENPVQNRQIYVRCNPEKIQLYQLFDLSGQIIPITSSENGAKLLFQIPENTKGGIYILRLGSPTDIINRRLLVID